MAVYLYEGLPGSGKSYHVLKDTIIGALKENRRVFHNLPIINSVLEASEFHIGYLRRRLIKVDEKFLLNLPKYKPVLTDSLLVIDEAHETFFSGDKIKDTHLRNFWTWHRHLNMDIAVVTQVKSNLNKIVQSVIAARFEFRNLGLLGLKGLYEIKQFEGYDGKTELGKKRGRFIKKYFDYYFSVDFGGSKLFKINTPASFSIYKVAGGLLLLFIVGATAFSSMSFFDSDANVNDRNISRRKPQERGFDTSKQPAINNRFGDPAQSFNNKEESSPVKYKLKVGQFNSLDGTGSSDGDSVTHVVKPKSKPVAVESEAFNKNVLIGRYAVSGFIGVGDKKLYILKNDASQKITVEGIKSLEVGRDIRVY